jgi:hypothetical protein
MPVEVAKSTQSPLAPAVPPAPPPPSPSDPHEIKARVELVRIAFSELRAGTAASTLAAFAFAVMVASYAGTPAVWAWLAFVLAVGGVRFWLAWAFVRRKPSPDETRI